VLGYWKALRALKGRRRAAAREARLGLPPRAASQGAAPRAALQGAAGEEAEEESDEDEVRSAPPPRGRAPESRARAHKKWNNWLRRRRSFDDADRDTNCPFAHCSTFIWLLVLCLLLLGGGVWWEWPSEALRAGLKAKRQTSQEASATPQEELEGVPRRGA
jgi:hypothetical protein